MLFETVRAGSHQMQFTVLKMNWNCKQNVRGFFLAFFKLQYFAWSFFIQQACGRSGTELKTENMPSKFAGCSSHVHIQVKFHSNSNVAYVNACSWVMKMHSLQIWSKQKTHYKHVNSWYFFQRSGRNTSSNTPQMRKTRESFGSRADKKERMRHNHFIKTAQPYKPKVMKFCSYV